MRTRAAPPQLTQNTPVYVVHEGDMLIDAPVEVVWPLVVDYPSWQNYTIKDHVAGPIGQEGEVVYLQKDEPGSNTTAYFARTIQIDPHRKILWKTFRDHQNYFGIVDFRTLSEGGKTRFTWNMMYEYIIPDSTEEERRAFQVEQGARVATLVGAIFPKLRALVENRRATGQPSAAS